MQKPSRKCKLINQIKAKTDKYKNCKLWSKNIDVLERLLKKLEKKEEAQND